MSHNGLKPQQNAGARRASSATKAQVGMTLLELIVSCAVLLMLSSMALPVARFEISRKKEEMLKYDLRQIRDAIDEYKDLTNRNLIRVEVGSNGYPPDLETLTKKISLGDINEHQLRLMRNIPNDPMTGKPDWGLRAVQDDPDAFSWGGKNVFDIYSKSQATGMNGKQYNTW